MGNMKNTSYVYNYNYNYSYRKSIIQVMSTDTLTVLTRRLILLSIGYKIIN